MTRQYGWHAQLAVGAGGMATVVAFLRRNGYVVEDVSAVRDYQHQDIDLRVRGAKRKRWSTVEVKTDTRTTGNVFLELVTAKGKPGCVFTSRAQVWLYYQPGYSQLLIIELPKLQLWLMEHGNEFARKQVGSIRGKGSWGIEGIAVPIERLMTDGLAIRWQIEGENDEISGIGSVAA